MPRRAMVVDDEDLVRSLLAEVLADEGFEVIEAGCGDEALALLDQVAPLDLLVTDVHMPGGADGYEVARQARARCAGLPIVVTTGRPEVGRPWLGGAGERTALVLKPFRIEAMLQAIGRVAA